MPTALIEQDFFREALAASAVSRETARPLTVAPNRPTVKVALITPLVTLGWPVSNGRVSVPVTESSFQVVPGCLRNKAWETVREEAGATRLALSAPRRQRRSRWHGPDKPKTGAMMTKTMTRRALVAGAAATLPATAVAATAIASAPDPHPAWADAFFAAWAEDDRLMDQAEAVWSAMPAELRRPRVEVGLRRGDGGAQIPMWEHSAAGIDVFIDQKIDALSVFGAAFSGPTIAALEARRPALKAELAASEEAQDDWLRQRGFHQLKAGATAARKEASRLKDLIVSTPATSMDGMAAQARILLHYMVPSGAAFAAAQALAASLGVTVPATVEG